MSRTCPINTPRFRTRFGQVGRIVCPVCFLVAAVCLLSAKVNAGELTNAPGVAVLLVDTDRVMGRIEGGIYGQFLEHINHSVWKACSPSRFRDADLKERIFKRIGIRLPTNGSASVVNVPFQNGEKSLRLQADNGTAGIRQGGIYLQQGHDYNGSVWLKPETGALPVSFRVKDSGGHLIAAAPLKTSGSDWQEVAYSFSNPRTDTNAAIEIVASGTGAVLVDYISMMRADVAHERHAAA